MLWDLICDLLNMIVYKRSITGLDPHENQNFLLYSARSTQHVYHNQHFLCRGMKPEEFGSSKLTSGSRLNSHSEAGTATSAFFNFLLLFLHLALSASLDVQVLWHNYS
jgi:hypothetical protein